jgi:ArsR family transcriptional regulator, arsenate/arsenite/antimonite-responsive transcriptional repressor
MSDEITIQLQPISPTPLGAVNALPPTADEEMITAVFKALADPNRRRIFANLMRGPSCNGWLNEQLGLAPNLLSHHLKVLREAGLIQDRRDVVDGRWVYYQVNPDTLTHLQAWSTFFFDPERIGAQPHFCGPEGVTTVNS